MLNGKYLIYIVVANPLTHFTPPPKAVLTSQNSKKNSNAKKNYSRNLLEVTVAEIISIVGLALLLDFPLPSTFVSFIHLVYDVRGICSE